MSRKELYATNAPRSYDYREEYEVDVVDNLDHPYRVLAMTEEEASYQVPRMLSGLWWCYRLECPLGTPQIEKRPPFQLFTKLDASCAADRAPWKRD